MQFGGNPNLLLTHTGKHSPEDPMLILPIVKEISAKNLEYRFFIFIVVYVS